MLRIIKFIACLIGMTLSANVLENVSYVCWFGFMLIANEIRMSRDEK